MKQENTHYRDRFDRVIADTLGQAIRIVAADPALVIPGSVLLHHQRKAAQVRKKYEQEGLLVPPVMIISITSRCNLACAGCYMKQQREHQTPEMSQDLLCSIVSEAADLGVSVVVIAGGEPLLRKDEILSLAHSFPHILFPLFTNGLMIDKDKPGS